MEWEGGDTAAVITLITMMVYCVIRPNIPSGEMRIQGEREQETEIRTRHETLCRQTPTFSRLFKLHSGDDAQNCIMQRERERERERNCAPFIIVACICELSVLRPATTAFVLQNSSSVVIPRVINPL